MLFFVFSIHRIVGFSFKIWRLKNVRGLNSLFVKLWYDIDAGGKIKSFMLKLLKIQPSIKLVTDPPYMRMKKNTHF